MTCPHCKTEIQLRAIPFGKIGKIEQELCECEAMKFFLKHQSAEKPKKARRK